MPAATTPPSDAVGSAPRVDASPAPKGSVPLWRCGMLLGIALLTLIVGTLNPSSSGTMLSGVAMTLPEIVKVPTPDHRELQFYGTKADITEGELGILPVDTELVRRKYDDIRDHESVLFTVLLSGVEQRSIHRAEVCLQGQGWSIESQDNFPVPLISGRTLVVRKLGISRDMVLPNNQHHTLNAFYMYWFVGDNLTTPSHIMRVLFNSWDRILYNHAYRWAYVMAMSPITASVRPDGLSAAQTQAMMSGFIRQTVPSFQKSEMPDQPSR